MEKNNTKQEILDTALELFSVQGFEATSISQIADAVGIRKGLCIQPLRQQAGTVGGIAGTGFGELSKAFCFCKGSLGRPCLYKG